MTYKQTIVLNDIVLTYKTYYNLAGSNGSKFSCCFNSTKVIILIWRPFNNHHLAAVKYCSCLLKAFMSYNNAILQPKPGKPFKTSS